MSLRASGDSGGCDAARSLVGKAKDGPPAPFHAKADAVPTDARTKTMRIRESHPPAGSLSSASSSKESSRLSTLTDGPMNVNRPLKSALGQVCGRRGAAVRPHFGPARWEQRFFYRDDIAGRASIAAAAPTRASVKAGRPPRLHAHAITILTLHARNTANITSVAASSTFSKEANFITGSPLPHPGATVSDSVRAPPQD
jgi:hypothetical protein